MTGTPRQCTTCPDAADGALDGLCTPCRTEHRTRDALTAIVTDRRRRGIPTQGVLMDGEKPDKITEIPL